jgi:hypothetical protein
MCAPLVVVALAQIHHSSPSAVFGILAALTAVAVLQLGERAAGETKEEAETVSLLTASTHASSQQATHKELGRQYPQEGEVGSASSTTTMVHYQLNGSWAEQGEGQVGGQTVDWAAVADDAGDL